MTAERPQAPVHLVLLLPAFVLVRLLYYALGVRFWAGPLDFYYQFLDPALLKTRLLESLWYLHAQPPLLNLIAGLALKIGGDRFALVAYGLNLAVSVVSWIAIARGLRLLGVGEWFAWVAATVFCCTPQFVLYENYFFYPHLCLGLLLFAFYSALRSQLRPNVWLGAFFASLAALVLLRSLYHPLYALALATVAVRWARKTDRRRIALLAAAPIGAVLVFCFKNLALFGFFGLSSWTGNGFHRTAVQFVDRNKLVPFIRTGEISILSLLQEYSSGDVFLKYFPAKGHDLGVPATDNYVKSSDHPDSEYPPINCNHWIYIEASGVLFSDALAIVRHFPREFLRVLGANLKCFFCPVSRDYFIHHFMLRNEAVFKRTSRGAEAVENFFPVKYGLIALFLWGSVRLVGRKPLDPGERFALTFVYATALWVLVVGNLFESGENNRFRYEILGLVWVVACREAHGLGALVARASSLRSARAERALRR